MGFTLGRHAWKGALERIGRKRGVFITFEGIEGSGKTTQLRALGAFLEQRGVRVRMTREPGGTPLGEAVREILLRPQSSKIFGLTELFLYGASRHQHVKHVLKPALEQGEVLLCDRFSDATLAYQGYGRGLDLQLVAQVNHWASEGLRPDLTILLDCSVEVGLKRSMQRLEEEGKPHESRFELESAVFHERVRRGYLEIARKDPQRVRIVGGEESPDAVQQRIRILVLTLLGLL